MILETINAKHWAQSHKLSLPNHWARSQRLSMPNHWARSQRLSMPNTGHNLINLSVPNHWGRCHKLVRQTGNNSSRTVIKVESIPTEYIFGFLRWTKPVGSAKQAQDQAGYCKKSECAWESSQVALSWTMPRKLTPVVCQSGQGDVYCTIGSGQYMLLSGRPVQTGQVLFESKFTTGIECSILQIKFNIDIIAIFASLFTNVVQLIIFGFTYLGQVNRNTRFAYLLISIFRFTENAQCTLSR